jgi:hypothetical protein
MAVYDRRRPFTTSSSWQAIDLRVATGFNTAEGFLGGCTLKGSVYLCPFQTLNQTGSIGAIAGNAHFFKYDSSIGLPTEQAAWSHFDATTLAAVSVGKRGWATCCTDYRYIYYAPIIDWGNAGIPHGLAIRYDSTLPFTEAGSWQTINLPTLTANLGGIQSVTFTGKHVYYVQTNGGAGITDYVARFNINGLFTNNSDLAWEYVRVSTLSFTNAASVPGLFVGSQFVRGRYLVCVPYGTNPTSQHGWVTIFDTLDPAAATLATSSNAWATFDLTTVNSRCKGYQFGWEAGDYLYLCPTNAGDGTPPPFIRWDMRKPFASAASWEIFTPAVPPPWLTGGVYDGTYAYLSPLRELGGDPSPGAYSGRVFRVYSPDYPAGQASHSMGDGYALYRDVNNNIGVNNTSPSFALDVVGTANAQTALRTSGFARVFGASTNTHGAFADIKGWEEVVTIASGVATTDTATNIPGGVLLLGISTRVNVQPPNSATYTVTGATSGTGYNIGANNPTTVGTTDMGTKAGAIYTGAAQKVRLTMNANPTDTTGRIVVNVHYIQITAPSS